MPLRTKPFDPANYLGNDAARAATKTEALATNDPAIIADALGVVARARGMSQVARDTGRSRESHYRALSAGGNPELSTLLQVVRALGLRLSATQAASRPGPA